jgi:F0F1-type ATP synthase assembly protein I
VSDAALLGRSERDLYKVSAIDLPPARRLAYGVVLGQAGVTVIAALCAWAWAGRTAGISALLGGGVSAAGSLAMALLGFRNPAGASGVALLAALLVGEAAKFCVIVVMFVLVLTLIKTSAAAMLGTYAATFLVYWIVLASWLPRCGGLAHHVNVNAMSEREMR